jgi:hypothetical protein
LEKTAFQDAISTWIVFNGQLHFGCDFSRTAMTFRDSSLLLNGNSRFSMRQIDSRGIYLDQYLIKCNEKAWPRKLGWMPLKLRELAATLKVQNSNMSVLDFDALA